MMACKWHWRNEISFGRSIARRPLGFGKVVFNCSGKSICVRNFKRKIKVFFFFKISADWLLWIKNSKLLIFAGIGHKAEHLPLAFLTFSLKKIIIIFCWKIFSKIFVELWVWQLAKIQTVNDVHKYMLQIDNIIFANVWKTLMQNSIFKRLLQNNLKKMEMYEIS